MRVPNYMCPHGSYYDMTLDTCVPITHHYPYRDRDFLKDRVPFNPPEQPEEVPTELIEEALDERVVKKQPKISPNQAVAKEIALRKAL